MTSTAKALQFPHAGIARDMDYRKAYIPNEGVAFATPFAVNVTGECTFSERKRGGSRPGLKVYTGVTESDSGFWEWPNGDKLCWSGTPVSHIIFDKDRTIVAPDGSILFDQHATFSVKASAGSVPETLTAIAKYRARLVVASGTMWYASRQGDTTNFDYGGDGEDVGRAVAGNVALADSNGDAVTAISAIEDRCLIVATGRSIRVLDGEPTNGTWSVASEHTGIISRDAWCWDGSTFWFVGQNGMYALVPGENVVKRVSGRLPEDLKGLTSATLVYDAERGGIHIISERTSGSTTTRYFWFYETGEQAFWAFEYPSTKRPTMGSLCVIGGVNRVIFRCADGVWRYPSDDTSKDEGSTTAEDSIVQSKVAIGPLRASIRDDKDGMLDELSATVGEGSADVIVEVYTAHSPEKAVKLASVGNSPKATYTLNGGWNGVWRPRVRGAWVIFVIKSNGRWAYESMTAVCKMMGRLR